MPKQDALTTRTLLNVYLPVYPGVPAAMAGVYFVPAETAQLDPENEKMYGVTERNVVIYSIK